MPNTVSNTKLIPCPFKCVTAPPVLKHEQRGPFATDYWVECPVCGARQRASSNPFDAMVAWNTRTAPALTPKQAAADEMAKALERIQDFDPEEEYNEPVDEWAQARAFHDLRNIARAVLAAYNALPKAGQP